MPKISKSEKKVPIGITNKSYLEIEEYAKNQDPQLFLFEVVEKAWEHFKSSIVSSKFPMN